MHVILGSAIRRILGDRGEGVLSKCVEIQGHAESTWEGKAVTNKSLNKKKIMTLTPTATNSGVLGDPVKSDLRPALCSA